MNLDEMQKRLQSLFVDKQRFEQESAQASQKVLMVQGHINELSFIIQSLSTPATQPEGEKDATKEGNESEDNLSEHKD